MVTGSYDKRRVLAVVVTLAVVIVLVGTAVWAQQGEGRRQLGFFDVWLFPRVWMSVLFSLVGLLLLVRSVVTLKLRLLVLPVVFFVFSVLWLLPLGSFAKGMGLHPSPVCTVTRPFQFLDAGRGIPILFLSIFASIAIVTVIGNKLFCGWVCPVGAVQEFLFRLPVVGRYKATLPFRVTNPIRIVVFVVFLPIVFLTAVNIYDYFNPFEFLHWGFELLAGVAFVVTLLAALFLFRPFCYLLCPLGLFTWFLEHLSVVKVKVNKPACTECDICVDESYCPAVRAILDERISRPDCHACGRCIELCPEDALSFRA